MSDLVALAKREFPPYCQVSHCSKDGCSVSLCDAPSSRAVVDLDRGELKKTPGKRCDYLFIGADDQETYVVSVELKSGGFVAERVVEQLQGGANIAASRLPSGSNFRFVPILAHGQGHPRQLRLLRETLVTMHGENRRVIAIKCGDPIANVLALA